MGDRSRHQITVNGTTYSSLAEVPEPYRESVAALLADRDGDGVADLFEGAADAPAREIRISTTRYTVDGVEYASLDDVPEPHRSVLRESAAEAEPDRTRPTPPTRPTAALTDSAPTRAPLVTTAGPSARTKLLTAFIAIDVAIAGLVIWFVTR